MFLSFWFNFEGILLLQIFIILCVDIETTYLMPFLKEAGSTNRKKSWYFVFIPNFVLKTVIIEARIRMAVWLNLLQTCSPLTWRQNVFLIHIVKGYQYPAILLTF